MVEVFKTNVRNRSHACLLIEQIHQTFPGYQANFDLDDCDKILRVASTEGIIQTALLLTVLKSRGFQAEILSDDISLDPAYARADRREIWN